ncbi:MAG: CinA family nicotinamide mononucleotide deamidase-related protein [Deltaproteobacteria bacterium]|nr:CinA family nicotinamide mononucleotide deamidase-related protein [Deltaproteobacteria bacterium]
MRDTLWCLTTGTEIVTGEVVNTNAAWLATACRELGIVVGRHLVVGDTEAAIGAACLEAVGRARVVIVTGGLGPTSDDVTLAAVSEAFGLPLEFHAALWETIQSWFARRGRECHPINQRMAQLPRGAVPVANAQGMAHGIRLEQQGTTFFFLPGIPAEVEHIFTAHIHPWLVAAGLGVPMGRRVLRCFGLPEASIGARIETLAAEALAGVEVGYRVVFPETWVKLVVRGDNVAAVEVRLARAERAVRAALGDVVYGTGDTTLAQVVAEALVARGATLAVAESCTGGAIADALTNIPGASRFFDRGIVAYSHTAKTTLLGVSDELLHQHGAVSEPVAAAMATGVRERAGTTYGLAITGIAGPTGGSPAKPVGTAYVAVAKSGGVRVTHHYWRGSRRPLQRQSRWSLPFNAAVRLGRGAPGVSPGGVVLRRSLLPGPHGREPVGPHGHPHGRLHFTRFMVNVALGQLRQELP